MNEAIRMETLVSDRPVADFHAATRQRRPNYKGHVCTAIAVAALLAIGGWFGVRWYFGPEVAVYPVQRADLVKTVVATGHVETPNRVSVGSQITGTVSQVLVEEGQRVARGERLILLKTNELEAAVSNAESAVAEAEARLRQLRDLTLPAAEQTLEQARANLVQAQVSFDRAMALSKSGYGTKATLDDATQSLDIARTRLRTAELQVAAASPGGADYSLQQTLLAQARSSLDTAKARLSYAVVEAPSNGTVIKRTVEDGTVVQAGVVLLVLAPTGDTQLVLDIDEKNIGLISLGQKALVSADAYPAQNFTAEVIFIGPSVDIDRAAVELKLTAADPPPYLRQDMTVSIDIEVASRPATLVVPVRTVHDVTGPEPYVLVAKEGRAGRRVVKLGLTSADKAEIVDGLLEGDLVVPAAAGVRAGQRIRPVRS